MNSNISKYGLMELEGMQFHAFHGCLESEKKEGNLFVVDFKAEYELEPSATSDSLEDTIDYGAVYEVIRREMLKPSDLLENVAARIAGAIDERFPGRFSRFKVSVAKRRPPVGGPCEWARISVSCGEEGAAL